MDPLLQALIDTAKSQGFNVVSIYLIYWVTIRIEKVLDRLVSKMDGIEKVIIECHKGR